jgi:hypothetical protein
MSDGEVDAVRLGIQRGFRKVTPSVFVGFEEFHGCQISIISTATKVLAIDA